MKWFWIVAVIAVLTFGAMLVFAQQPTAFPPQNARGGSGELVDSPCASPGCPGSAGGGSGIERQMVFTTGTFTTGLMGPGPE